jgi:hypothetical protein
MALVTWRQHERKRKFSSCANKFYTATDNTHQYADLAPANSPNKQMKCRMQEGCCLATKAWLLVVLALVLTGNAALGNQPLPLLRL